MSTPVILNENTVMRSDETGAARMRNRCAFTTRDMAADWPASFTHAIVVGWGDDWEEQAKEWGWDEELVSFLWESHKKFQQLADRKEKK